MARAAANTAARAPEGRLLLGVETAHLEGDPGGQDAAAADHMLNLPGRRTQVPADDAGGDRHDQAATFPLDLRLTGQGVDRGDL